MPRKSKATALTVAVFGAGAVTGKPGIEALLADWVDTQEKDVTFVFPFSDATFTESVETVFEWVLEQGFDILGVVDPSFEGIDEYRPDFAGPAFETKLVREQITTLLQEADDAAAIILWDDEDQEVQAMCLHLSDPSAPKVPLYEMSSGLAVIERLYVRDDEEDDETPTNNTKEAPVADEEETDAPEAEETETDEDFVPYTRAELEKMGENDRDELKAVASEDFGLDISSPRIRTSTLVDMILEAQEKEGLDPSAAPAEEDAGEDDEPADDEATETVSEVDLEALKDAIVSSIVEETGDLVKDLLEPVLAEIGALKEAIADLKASGAKGNGETASGAPVRRRRR